MPHSQRFGLSRLLPIGVLLAASIAPSLSRANSLTIFSSKRQEFKNPDCAKNNTCDLKSFSLTAENYAVDISDSGFTGLNYGTRMYAGFQTDKVSDLYHYGLVQLIKGCLYTSELRNGKVINYLNVNREFYGQDITFKHPQWVIDGVVSDPMDWGFDPNAISRFLYYKWSPVAGDFKSDRAKYVIEAPPQTPALFVTDHPGQVVNYDAKYQTAHNVSLQLKICLYRTADVPKVVPPDQIDFAKPIQCFPYSASWVYNFKTHQYESPTEISPICSSPEMPYPFKPSGK